MVSLAKHETFWKQKDPAGESGSTAEFPPETAEVLRKLLPIEEIIPLIRSGLVVSLALRTEVAPPPPSRPGAEARVVTPLFLQGETEQIAMTRDVLALFVGAHLNQPSSVWKTLLPLTLFGMAAVLETAADLAGTADVSDFETNTLSWLGNRVSYHLRRAVLLKSLEEHAWNLAKTGEALHMGSTPHVLRAIRDLGLLEAYEKAKEAGIPRRGGRGSKAK